MKPEEKLKEIRTLLRRVDELLNSDKQPPETWPTREFNGYVVPAPVTDPGQLVDGLYFVMDSYPLTGGTTGDDVWSGNPTDRYRLACGLVFRSADDALRNFKALIGVHPDQEMPFLGRLEEGQKYFLVYKFSFSAKWAADPCANNNVNAGARDVATRSVYLDLEVAQHEADRRNAA